MPAWESVNAVKSPTAKSGINELTLAPNPITSPPAATERTRMPFESTSRSPRLASCRGMKPSRAMIADRRGKSAYAVLADSVRIAAVDACRTI